MRYYTIISHNINTHILILFNALQLFRYLLPNNICMYRKGLAGYIIFPVYIYRYISLFSITIIAFWLFTPQVHCDAPRAWGLYFQNSASTDMEFFIELHDNILYDLITTEVVCSILDLLYNNSPLFGLVVFFIILLLYKYYNIKNKSDVSIILRIYYVYIRRGLRTSSVILIKYLKKIIIIKMLYIINKKSLIIKICIAMITLGWLFYVFLSMNHIDVPSFEEDYYKSSILFLYRLIFIRMSLILALSFLNPKVNYNFLLETFSFTNIIIVYGYFILVNTYIAPYISSIVIDLFTVSFFGLFNIFFYVENITNLRFKPCTTILTSLKNTNNSKLFYSPFTNIGNRFADFSIYRVFPRLLSYKVYNPADYKIIASTTPCVNKGFLTTFLHRYGYSVFIERVSLYNEILNLYGKILIKNPIKEINIINTGPCTPYIIETSVKNTIDNISNENLLDSICFSKYKEDWSLSYLSKLNLKENKIVKSYDLEGFDFKYLGGMHIDDIIPALNRNIIVNMQNTIDYNNNVNMYIVSKNSYAQSCEILYKKVYCLVNNTTQYLQEFNHYVDNLINMYNLPPIKNAIEDQYMEGFLEKRSVYIQDINRAKKLENIYDRDSYIESTVKFIQYESSFYRDFYNKVISLHVRSQEGLIDERLIMDKLKSYFHGYSCKTLGYLDDIRILENTIRGLTVDIVNFEHSKISITQNIPSQLRHNYWEVVNNTLLLPYDLKITSRCKLHHSFINEEFFELLNDIKDNFRDDVFIGYLPFDSNHTKSFVIEEFKNLLLGQGVQDISTLTVKRLTNIVYRIINKDINTNNNQIPLPNLPIDSRSPVANINRIIHSDVVNNQVNLREVYRKVNNIVTGESLAFRAYSLAFDSHITRDSFYANMYTVCNITSGRNTTMNNYRKILQHMV